MNKGKGNIIQWIILAGLGVFLILGNRLAQGIMGKVFAIALLAVAISGIWAWWKGKQKTPDAIARLCGSIVMGGVGAWALLDTTAFITFLNVVLGLIMIVTGVLGFCRGWKAGKDKLTMILAVIGMILGLVIACNNAATTWVTIAEGIGLIYTAVTGFLGEWKKEV